MTSQLKVDRISPATGSEIIIDGWGTNPIKATGGSITTFGDYTVHTFTTSGNFEITEGEDYVEYLIVAGGGGGGNGYGGGGGAGGYRCSVPGELSGANSNSENPLNMTTGVYPVVVGAGGAGGPSDSVSGSKGDDSSFGNITSLGGGGGNWRLGQPEEGSGGCGGGIGAKGGQTPREGTFGQGFDGNQGESYSAGGHAGGGGGAGQVHKMNTEEGYWNGNNGISSSIDGSATTRSGGGAAWTQGVTSTPGLGGGGQVDDDGVDSTGGGGGGLLNSKAGNGGSGIVILRYKS